MLSCQEIIQKVAQHLLTQHAVSEDESGSCRLRGTDGRKCAIGSLVADEHYCAELERVGISYYRGAKDGALLRALKASGVDASDSGVIELLIELEEVHDEAAVDQWATKLARIGHEHGCGLQPLRASNPGQSHYVPMQGDTAEIGLRLCA
jgi:hypothetical protein